MRATTLSRWQYLVRWYLSITAPSRTEFPLLNGQLGLGGLEKSMGRNYPGGRMRSENDS